MPQAAAPAGGWRQLLAQVLGGAAVAAVGALFGEVAGAALQGAAEPLVRRVADWAAARRPAREGVDEERSPVPGAAPASAEPAADVPRPTTGPTRACAPSRSPTSSR